MKKIEIAVAILLMILFALSGCSKISMDPNKYIDEDLRTERFVLVCEQYIGGTIWEVVRDTVTGAEFVRVGSCVPMPLPKEEITNEGLDG